MKYIISILITILVTAHLSAQTPQVLSPEDIQGFNRKAQRFIYNFFNGISTIVKTQDKLEKNRTGNGIIQDFTKEAIIEVIPSVKNPKVIAYPIREYIEKVKGYNEKYKIVIITFEGLAIEKFEEKKDKNGGVYYEATYKFTLYFNASKSGKTDGELPVFEVSDQTKKEGTVILEKIITRKGEKWDLKLHNIKAKDIK